MILSFNTVSYIYLNGLHMWKRVRRERKRKKANYSTKQKNTFIYYNYYYQYYYYDYYYSKTILLLSLLLLMTILNIYKYFMLQHNNTHSTNTLVSNRYSQLYEYNRIIFHQSTALLYLFLLPHTMRLKMRMS